MIPAGTGQTDLQLQVIDRCSPPLCRHALVPAHPCSSAAAPRACGSTAFRHRPGSAEAFPRALAEELQAQYGVDAYQCYATSDIGLIAYETEARDGLVIDEGVLVEVVRPGTGQPVPAGEVGEVVVTTFNPDYPLIRFATGDLSAIMPGMSPCGRTNRRLRGWLGRADQSTKVKGMFVHPAQVAKVARRHGEIGRARLVVERFDRRDQMTLFCEFGPAGRRPRRGDRGQPSSDHGPARQRHAGRAGALANDGKVIDDRRPVD